MGNSIGGEPSCSSAIDPAIVAWDVWHLAVLGRASCLAQVPADQRAAEAERIGAKLHDLHFAVLSARATTLNGVLAKIDAYAALLANFETLDDDAAGILLLGLVSDLRAMGATRGAPHLSAKLPAGTVLL